MVGGVGGVWLPTVMSNAGSAVVCPASVTVMTTPESVPTSLAPGVPTSCPVALLNVAHEGLFVTEKVSPLPEACETLGWKEYTAPTMALAAAVPEIVAT